MRPRWWHRFTGGTPPTVPFSGRVVFDVPTLRLASWVQRSVPDPAAVLARLRSLPHAWYGGQDPERVQTALVRCALTDPEGWDGAMAVLEQDWRDVLVAGGLADAGWERRLDELLGPVS